MTNLARGDYSTAADINAAGHVVGSNYLFMCPTRLAPPITPTTPIAVATAHYDTCAVLWENGVGTDLTSLLLQIQALP